MCQSHNLGKLPIYQSKYPFIKQILHCADDLLTSPSKVLKSLEEIAAKLYNCRWPTIPVHLFYPTEMNKKFPLNVTYSEGESYSHPIFWKILKKTLIVKREIIPYGTGQSVEYMNLY